MSCPDLPVDGQPSESARLTARERLAVAVERSRTGGEPATDLARTLGAMSVDDAVDEIERRLRRALTRQTSGLDALRAVDDAASALEAVDLLDDAARLRLMVAAALEGRELGSTMQDLRLTALMIASAVAEEVDGTRSGAEPVGDFIALAFDGEGDVFADTVARGKRNELVALGVSLREALLEEGRIVAVGRCRRCRRGLILDRDSRCPECGRRLKNVDFVTTGDANAALRHLG